MRKKFNSIKESVEHTLNNTVFPDSIINYMAQGDKTFIKKMKKRREQICNKLESKKGGGE